MSEPEPGDDTAPVAPTRRVLLRRGQWWPPTPDEWAENDTDTADHWDERVWRDRP